MKRSLKCVLPVAITVFAATVSAASESPWHEPVDVAFRARWDGTTQRYVLLVPQGLDATQPVDLIVALHGHGSDRWQFIRQGRSECRALRDAAARYGMIVVAPDYRAKTSWMGPAAEADMLQILDEIQEKYHVRHTFVCGGSMGGSSALTFAVLHPDRVHGVVALNGTANHVEYAGFQDAIRESFGGTKEEVPGEYRRRSAELRPERLTMPMAATVGGRDKTVPPDTVRRLFAVLKDKRRPVLLIDRPEGGHATDYQDTTAAIRFVVEKVRSLEGGTLEGDSPIFAARKSGQSPDCVPPVENLNEAVAWLERESRRMIRACRREMNDGTAAFPPQVGIGYNAFWLRDYAYMLEGCIEGFEEKELRDACLMFVRAQREDGACVDCVKYDGTPIYKPGYGSMGENPVADGSQFTVDVAWHTYRRLGDRGLLEQIIERLIKGMKAVPRNPETGLVHIRPDRDWDRCPYGFTDTVRKQGDLLFSSLLYVQAGRQLAELLEVLQRSDEALEWRGEADKVAATIREVFWDPGIGLFRAATVKCKEPDVWGSAFAVYLHVAAEDQAIAIARYFDEHYGQIVQKGQIRHLPGGVYWQEACPRDRYQNGAFWATATGWFVYALDLVDPKLADQTIIDLVTDFQERGCLEWCFGDLAQRPDYLASGTMPLAGIRKVIRRREERGVSAQPSGELGIEEARQ